MKIRKATKKDFKEISKIMMNESSKRPYNGKDTLRTALKEIIEYSKKDLYVAVNEKEIIGFMASNIIQGSKKAYIKELWLKPIYQGKGVGKTLVKFIENKYKKRGINIIRLVTKRNAGAFKFYKKLKYIEHKTLVFMEKKLK